MLTMATCQCDDKNAHCWCSLGKCMALPVLVTGFEKFGEHSTNISAKVAQAISNHNVRGHIIESLVLSVDENGSRVVANRITNGEKFAAIMHIGLAENENKARIEVQAKDILDFRMSDNSGRQPIDEKISGEGDLTCTIVVEDWDVERMIESPKISYDAGEYLCNETLYRTLHTISDNTPCFFLHLPLAESIDDPIGLALQCVDRMLRPPCIDVGAGAIMSEGKFLAARRAPNEKHAGWWEFPGGKFEPGEDVFDCLRREIMEELELEVEVKDNIGTWIFDHDDVVVRLHVYECRIIGGEIKLHVHDQIRWCVGPDEIPWLGPDYEIAAAISAK